MTSTVARNKTQPTECVMQQQRKLQRCIDRKPSSSNGPDEEKQPMQAALREQPHAPPAQILVRPGRESLASPVTASYISGAILPVMAAPQG